MSSPKFSAWKFNLMVSGVYFLVTIIVYYPAFLTLVTPSTIPSTSPDGMYFLWHLWWIKHALLELGVSPTFTRSIFYPVGGVLFLAAPFYELASLTWQPLIGLTRTYALLWLFSFPTAGFTMYLLGYYFTRRRGAAFIGGLIFSFSAYHYDQADKAHIGLLTIQWLPLYALALFLLLKKSTLKRAALTAITFILAVMSEHVYYLFYFALPITGLFIIYHWLAGVRRLKFWLLLSGALLVGLLAVFPIYLHLLPNRNESFINGGGITRYSADVLAYLTPLKAYKYTGHDLFIGYAALGLALISLRKQPAQATRFWLLVGGLAFIFSLGPLLRLNGLVELPIDNIDHIKTYVPLPYALLVNTPLLGSLRAPARLAVLVQLAVAVLAVYGLAALSRRWQSVTQIGGCLALGLFILFESSLQLSPAAAKESLIPPPIYEQIAQEKNQLAVLEIPSRAESKGLDFPEGLPEQKMYTYMYYATIHQHPLVGGKSARTPPAIDAFMDTTLFIRELMHPASLTDNTPDIMAVQNDELVKHGAELLARYDIGYVVLHRDLLAKYMDQSGQSLPEKTLRQALGDPFYDQGSWLGFRVPQGATPVPWTAKTLAFGDGWYPQTMVQNRPLRWLRQTGTLLLSTPTESRERLAVTAFSAMPVPLTITVSLNGAPVQTWQIASTSAEHPETYLTRPLGLTVGLNEVKFEAEPVNIAPAQMTPQVYLGVYSITQTSVVQPENVAPLYPQQVNVADKIELLGYDLSSQSIQSGETLRLTLYWQALHEMEDSYKVFVHILDSANRVRAQQDKIPHDWQLPTTAWGSQEIITDTYEFVVPSGVPPGDYHIQVGLYSAESLHRLEVSQASQPTRSDVISLGHFQIK